jgi:hypothetical protein
LRRRDIDVGDLGVSKQGANERDGEGTGQGQVLDVTSLAPEKAGVFLAEDTIPEDAQGEQPIRLDSNSIQAGAVVGPGREQPMVGRDESSGTGVDPDDWFTDADPASFEPRELTRGEVGAAHEPTWLEDVGEHEPPAADSPLADRRLVALAAAVLLLLVGVAVAFVAFGGGGDSTPTVPTTTARPTTTAPAATVPATPPPAPAVSLPAGVVKPGATGTEVKAVQRALARAGHSPGPIDGDYGPKTVQALSDFQRSAGITADGIYGPQTKKALQQHLTSG